MSVQEALEALDHASWVEQLERYRRLDAPDGEHDANPITEDHAGHPLGPGYPTGRPLRRDGETHREAWARLVRRDPCSYCGRAGGTLDHIEPRNPLVRARGLGGAHSWLNYAGACGRCNRVKGSRSLLDYLLACPRRLA